MDVNPLGEDGLERAIDMLVAAIRTNQSGVEEVAALTEHVSQLRSVNQNLVLATLRAQVMQEEAELRNRQQIEFLAMLAHELRNPLAPISNAASLLKQVTAAHPVLPKIQGVISRQVEHLAHLIDDLLDASRITSGKIALQKTMVALDDVIGRSVQMVQPSIDKRRQRLLMQPLPDQTWLEGDALRLSQALSNLLINASKFTKEGGEIFLDASCDPDAVRLTVRDTGVGIEADLLPHVFDLFRQGPRSLARSEGGLGIGLSVAKGLIEMHGGQIFARSGGRNKGSEFTISLPGLATPGPAVTIAASETDVPFASGCRILLIEDNPDTNSTLQLLLELAGHQVTVAYDGPAGLAFAKANRFDAVVCDIGLPGLDGYGVIRQIRQLADLTQPLAVALSGYGQPEDHARALDAGFDEYLVKPASDAVLLSLIARRTAA